MNDTKRIDWNYPEPKTGMDKFIGPGATQAEKVLQNIVPFLFTGIIVAMALFRDWGWNWYQYIVGALLALDMMGGVITNATSSAKRWYHREDQGVKQHMTFVAIHLLQLVILVAAFDRWNWVFMLGSYLYLLVASAVIVKSPLYLQRPVAMALLVGGIFMGIYLLPVPVHFEWFLPVFYTKLLVSHLLMEEPYRPENE